MHFRKRYWIVIGAPVLLGSIYYGGCVHRTRIHTERAGWTLDFSYIRWRCPTCFGRVETMTCKGRSVPVPSFQATADGRPRRLRMYTPVGCFEWSPGTEAWRNYHHAYAVKDARDSITALELAHGYYDVSELHAGNESGVLKRKQGTPDHWCLIWTYHEQGTRGRWLDPGLIPRLDWQQPTSSPSTRQTDP